MREHNIRHRFPWTFRSALPLQVPESPSRDCTVFSVISAAGRAAVEGRGTPPTLTKDPSHFGARREVQKVALKRNPSSRPSLVPFGRIGGHHGRRGGQKGCEMEVQKGVRNGAKSRAPTKSGKSEFDTLFIMF